MAITFRANKGTALSYGEMDTNLGSYFYSSSREGNELLLHYTSSNNVPVNLASHRISLATNAIAGGVDLHIPIYNGTSDFETAQGFIFASGSLGVNVKEVDYHSLTYAVEVSGSVRTSGGVLTNSDSRIKQNIQPYNNALERITNSRGVTYELIGGGERHLGVIAQEIQPHFPEVVSTDKKGLLSVDYSKLTAALIEGIKEQQQQIDRLTARVAELENNQ